MTLGNFIININNRKYEFYYKLSKKKQDSKYFQKIITGGVYRKINLNHNIDIILDIGANIGATSIFFALNYPNSTIFSFEPVSETYDILLKNTKLFNNIFCKKYAVTNNTGEQQIYIDQERLGRSSLIEKHRNMDISYSEKTKTINLNNFIDENNISKIDILKIDCEGSEVEILDSIKNYLSKISLIYIEIHGENKIKYLTDLLKKTHNEIVSIPSKGIKESIFLNKIFKANK